MFKLILKGIVALFSDFTPNKSSTISFSDIKTSNINLKVSYFGALICIPSSPLLIITSPINDSISTYSLVPEMVTIGKDFISAPNSIILAHDASTFKHCGKHRVEHTIIGDCVFLGAGAIILPGINVGDNVIIGAGSIVTRNIESNMVVAGNPAKVICTTSEYIEKCNNRNVLVDTPNCFRGDGIKVNKVCIEEVRNNVRKKQGF